MQQLTLALPYSPSYDPADFIVCSANGEAFGQIKRFPEWHTRGLIIVGDAGSGKTHLLEVHRSQAPTAKVLNPQDVNKKTIFELKDSHIALEDAEQIKDQISLFHLINKVIYQQKGTLYINAAIPPENWKITLPDLKSRLKMFPVIKIQHPDAAILKDYLLKLFSDRQIKIDNTILDYIAERLIPRYDMIKRFIMTIDVKISQKRKSITKILVKQVFADNPELQIQGT